MGTALKIERPEAAARHCFDAMPYRALVFARLNASTPLFYVAGVTGGPWGAERALRAAHAVHGGSCFYCERPVASGALSIDHADPRAAGGGRAPQNLLIACKPCNLAKGHQPIELFKPDAGRDWLTALLQQVQDRLNRLE